MSSAWAPLQTNFRGEILASQFFKCASRVENHNTAVAVGVGEATGGVGTDVRSHPAPSPVEGGRAAMQPR